MKIFKESTTLKVDKVVCDLCNKETEPQDSVTIKHSFGYNSDFDCSALLVDICEDCLSNQYKDFIRSPNDLN